MDANASNARESFLLSRHTPPWATTMANMQCNVDRSFSLQDLDVVHLDVYNTLRLLVSLQLELQSQEMLAKHWRHLAKKEAKAAKAAKEAGTEHVPAAETPEATFLPRLLADFLQVQSLAYLTWTIHAPGIQGR